MLELIDLEIEELGYREFISAWLYTGNDGNFLVDPGPACTADFLLAELENRGVKHLDWIFLTHIHMDHAGGIGHVLDHFPSATIICHEKAVRHLEEPQRLWKGSVKVLGDVARVYGRIKPVPAENIRVAESVPVNGGIRVLPTPGHAAHHQCFVGKDVMFCGEVFGIFCRLENEIYLRPATPPVFVFEDFLNSMDRIGPYMDRRICFAHYGDSDRGPEILKTARQQLRLWVEVVGRYPDLQDMDAIIAELTAKDPVYARKERLPKKTCERETYFTGNSVQGIWGYLKKKKYEAVSLSG